VNFGTFYVFLRCAVDKCANVSEKRTTTETSHNSQTARHKIPTDHKLTNETRNLTNSKCPQTVLQLPNINVTLWTDRQTAVLNGAADFYSFGTKLHNVGLEVC